VSVKLIKKTFQYGEHTITLETGAIARQATAAVLVTMGDTVVLVTVVGKKEVDASKDFFPLTVHYLERYYAAGRFPGGFVKRESKPSTSEVLTSRLIDRPLRPLFPDGFTNEIQVVATVMSLDPEISGDIPALIGASSALAISGIPFNGPLAAAKVGYINENYILNPTTSQIKTSQLDLVVAGTKEAVLMVESEAKELSKEIMLGAVMFGHQRMQVVIDAINEFAGEAGKAKWEWKPKVIDNDLVVHVSEIATPLISEIYQVKEKTQRQEKVIQ